MVLSPPSSRAAEAAPEDPVAAAGSGAGGPAAGAEGAAPGIPGPEAGSSAGAAGGRRVVRCRRRLCVRPGSPRGAGGSAARPDGEGRAAPRAASLPFPRTAGGRVSTIFGSRRPLLLTRGSPLPAGSALTDGATATTRRRCCGCSQLLALDAPAPPASALGEGGGTHPKSGRQRYPIHGPLGSFARRPLVFGAGAVLKWVGPPSGLSVAVAAGILAH